MKACGGDKSIGVKVNPKFLRMARTMADLEGAESILPQHVAEAVGYRSLDRSVFA